ncbi:hypothetical protein ASE75_03565 [Sphingomonas sp. Leaf17]|nr:hypothetical protein ASE75_03565 [Sphingomonas sp. Leaf17]
MAKTVAGPWDATAVQAWLAARMAAARSDQVVAERTGYTAQDDCDKANAEEMVCTLMAAGTAVTARATFLARLQSLSERDDYIWRGVYNDTRFDRHVRSYIRKLVRMAKTSDGFGNIAHYQ